MSTGVTRFSTACRAVGVAATTDVAATVADRRGDLRAAEGEYRLEERNERAGVAAGAELADDPLRERGIVAETGGERTARAEEQRLDRGLGELELLGDLLVREALPLAEQERATLLCRQALERLGKTDQLVGVRLRRGKDVLHRIEVAGRLDAATAERRALAGETDVLGDLVEPRRLELGVDAALEAAEGIEERRLHRVLRLFLAAELVVAVGVDLAGVALVEVTGRVGFGRRALRGDLRGPAYGRNGNQPIPSPSCSPDGERRPPTTLD